MSLTGQNWWTGQQMETIPEEIQQELILAPNTKAVCTSCGREDAHKLYMKRQGGRYVLLCKMLDGSGCYPQSHRSLCCHIAADVEQCLQLAEWRVEFADSTKVYECCSDHLGRIAGLFPSNTRQVYPIEG
jgi:hypothetical protein